MTPFEPVPTPKAPRRRSRAWLVLAFLVLLAVSSFVAWFYFKTEEIKREQRKSRISFLERQGATLIENRRWEEAARTFEEIDQLAPGSEIASQGRRNIEAGKIEEHNQFIAYWSGHAIAELEAGRLDDAEAAVRHLLGRFPDDPQAANLQDRIAAARITQARADAIHNARQLLNQQQWQSAIQAAQQILATVPDDPEAQALLAEATAALEKQAADHAKALKLLEQAAARDNGQFDQQALDWLREAATLAPADPQIAAQLEKMSSYTRTIRVPEDFATPDEALDSARDRDRVVLGPQTWKGPLVIRSAVVLEGAGPDKTIVECPAEIANVIVIAPEAQGARISGITFRHESFHADGADRFSAALVRGKASFSNCHFLDASGHGLVVTGNGSAAATHCRFSGNGWNGAAANGKNASLEVRDSSSIGNFEHGIETWDGATASIVNNRCEANSRNGIHADNLTASATIESNQLVENREFGIVLDSAGSGKITGNTARGNLLGGIVIRAAAFKLPVTGNHATRNQGPGLVLEQGLTLAHYQNNRVDQNQTPEILTGVNLSPVPPEAPDTPAPPKAIPVLPIE